GVAAQRRGFDHTGQRLRDTRAEAAARTAAADALTAAGITVVDRPGWDDKTIKRLADLMYGDEPLTEDNHAACPGHAAYLDNKWIYPDADDHEDSDAYDGEGDGTDRDDVDLDDGEGDDGEGDDGGDPGEHVRPHREWVPVYVCTDFAAHGHTPRWGGHDSGSGRKTTAEMTDDERAAARAERRDVIQSNKDWDSAETV